MKILLNMMKYEYGCPEQGFSFEYNVFGKLLEKIEGAEVELFDFREIMKKEGKRKMNELLLQKSKEFKPDLIFSFLFIGNEIEPETFENFKKYSKASITWMADDKWRWNSFGSKYCNFFDYVITTDPEAVGKYERIGYKNAILSQWAVDPSVYKKKNIKKDIPVSFVGRDTSWRRYVVKELKRKGIEVDCYGWGWENGRVTLEEMIDIFNRSKINLNLSNSVIFDLKYLLNINLVWNKDIPFLRNIYTIFGPQADFLLTKKRVEDIKSRFFEVIGCGGFLLSYDVDYLSEYFEKEKELETYTTVDDLASKIFYYLGDDKKREDIALRGYNRVLREHTYERRFEEIFKILGKKEKVFNSIKFKI